MLQEDSNGESSFEFIEKKSREVDTAGTGSGTSLSSISPDYSFGGNGGGNILSNVKPPSDLPEFPIWTPSTIASPETQPSVLPPPPKQTTPIVSTQSPIQLPKQFTQSQPLPQAITQPLMYSVPPSGTQTYFMAPPMPQPTAPTTVTGITPALPASITPQTSVTSTGIQFVSSQPETFNETSSSGFMNMVKGAFAGKGVLQRMAEKAKNSVDSIITTLDPQMSEYIYSGGDIEITVTSKSDDEISAVREAFHSILGKAWVNGVDLSLPAKQTLISGIQGGFAAAEEKIEYSLKYRNTPTIGIESILIFEANNWYYLDVLVLRDAEKQIVLQTFSQAIPLPVEEFLKVLERERPNYNSMSTEEKLSMYFQIHPNWQVECSGCSRKEVLLLSAKVLAKLYKNKLWTN